MKSHHTGLWPLAAACAILSCGAGADESLQEIVVTAQMRQQNLQDTPVAITAVNAEMMEERGQSSLHDLAQQAPGSKAGAHAAAGARMSGPRMQSNFRGAQGNVGAANFAGRGNAQFAPRGNAQFAQRGGEFRGDRGRGFGRDAGFAAAAGVATGAAIAAGGYGYGYGHRSW